MEEKVYRLAVIKDGQCVANPEYSNRTTCVDYVERIKTLSEVGGYLELEEDVNGRTFILPADSYILVIEKVIK